MEQNNCENQNQNSGTQLKDQCICYYTNADSLLNKIEEMKAWIQEKRNGINMIGITEIYPKHYRFVPSKADMPGYKNRELQGLSGDPTRDK